MFKDSQANLIPLFVIKDAETHGGEKRISANISMLEANKLDPARGRMLLRYAACTPEDCQYMLGKALFKNMKGVRYVEQPVTLKQLFLCLKESFHM